jgi:hypothetical protein
MGEESGHPSSWRLFRAHPALGLEETDSIWVWRPEPHELGLRWLSLAPAEQRAQEADLLDALRLALRPESGHELELMEETEPGTVGVWMDRWKAPALERELLDHVLDRARERTESELTRVPSEIVRRRGAARELRARLLLGWKRASSFLAPLLAALLAKKAWDDGVGAVLLAVGSAFLLFGVLDRLAGRCYRCAQREPE